MRVLGLDIGGANIKAATETGEAMSVPFEVWRDPESLPSRLQPILERFSSSELLAVTMTAELADCFATKAEGIDSVLRSVESIAAGRPIRVWQTSGEFVSPEVARDEPRLTAAANWHAQATFLGRLVPRGSALLIDVGSTTSDLIPLINGLPKPAGRTDVERLQSGELVYSGVRRTPLCAIVETVMLEVVSKRGQTLSDSRETKGSDPFLKPPLSGSPCRIAAELFATTLDLFLISGDIAENSQDHDTANGRPATIAAAFDRLARLLCCDITEVSQTELRHIAGQIAETQLRRLCLAASDVVSRLPAPCENVLISGSGSFLARRVVENTPALTSASLVSIPALLGPRIADSACAFAVAKLAAERELPFLF